MTTLGIILAVILGVVCCINVYFNLKNSYYNKYSSLLKRIFWLTLFIFVLVCAIPAKTVTHSVEIQSVERETHLEGVFVLGCGTIEQEPVYLVYVKDELGNFNLKQLDYHAVAIKETDSIPHVVYKRHEGTFGLKSKYSTGDMEYGTPVVLYVPKGSIIKRFNL